MILQFDDTLLCELKRYEGRWILLLAIGILTRKFDKVSWCLLEWDKLTRRDRIYLYVCSMIKRPNDGEHENFCSLTSCMRITSPSFFTCALHLCSFFSQFYALTQLSNRLLFTRWSSFHMLDRENCLIHRCMCVCVCAWRQRISKNVCEYM